MDACWASGSEPGNPREEREQIMTMSEHGEDITYGIFLRHSSKNKAVVRLRTERLQSDRRTDLGTSGLDLDNMPENQKRVINNLPAMLYHGVNMEAAVLMRMNAVPRSIARALGEQYPATVKEESDFHSVRSARSYLRSLSPTDGQRSAPPHARMSGEDYRGIWSLLAGESLARRENT